MTFITAGLAVAGAIGMLIPIIIHLLSRQRRKPVEWAAMRFLIEAFRKHKRRLQLEQWLLLAVRCLILALFGAALARPILRAAGIAPGGVDRSVILVVDDGMASGVGASADENALARHVARARTVIESLGPSEPVGLITASRPVESVVVPPSIDHAAVIRLLDSLEPAASPSDLPGALEAARDAAAELRAEGQQVAVVLLSEFRAGSASLEAPLPELFAGGGEDLILLSSPPAAEESANVQVVAVEPVRRLILPGATDGSQQVSVRLARHGGELGRAASRVRLSAPGLPPIAAQTVAWSPGQSAASVAFNLDFSAASGEQIAITAIIDDADTLDADNTRSAILDVRERMRVAMISPPTFERLGLIEQLSAGQWIRRALRTSEQSPFDIIDVPPAALDDVDLRGVDVGILVRPDRLADSGWRALGGFVERGGLLVIVPPDDATVHPWTDRLPVELNLPWRIELESVDHPEGLSLGDEQPDSELLALIKAELNDLTRSLLVWRTLPVDTSQTRAANVLEFDDGTPFMIVGGPALGSLQHDNQADAPADQPAPSSGGLVVYIACAPELSQWTNLPVQTFMVPLFQETVRQGVSLIRASQQVVVGEQAAIAGLPLSAATLRSPGAGQMIDLDAVGRPSEPIRAAGVFEVLDDVGRNVGRVAANVDPAAGVTSVQSEQQVGQWLGRSGAWSMFSPDDPAAALATRESGRSLARPLLALVLALIVVEALLARRFSHASLGRGGAMLEGGLRPTVADARTIA